MGPSGLEPLTYAVEVRRFDDGRATITTLHAHTTDTPTREDTPAPIVSLTDRRKNA